MVTITEKRARDAARSAKYRKAHPGRQAAASAKWKKANPEKVRAYQARPGRRGDQRAATARWRATHPDTRNAWQKANPEHGKAMTAARRTRETGAGGRFSIADLRAQYAVQSGLCFYCRTSLDGNYQIDHKIPVERGGTSWPENIVCSCALCNKKKGTMTDVEFMTSRADLR